MRHFLVTYQFRKGINGSWENRVAEITFDDIDPETTDAELKKMACRDVEQRFINSIDYPLYGQFWNITTVEEVWY